MGGHRVPEQGPNDDGFEENGYDESQRAEILEATRGGPDDGAVLTDIDPDLGENDDAEDEDETLMADDDLGEEDEDIDLDEIDRDEDEAQADFDDGTVEDDDGDDDLDDAERTAIEP